VTSAAVPAKRKRGRPRNPLPADNAGGNAGIARAKVPRPVGRAPVEQNKRRLGVKKSGLAIKVPPGYIGLSGPTELVIKRKRGRPRKNPRTEAGVSDGTLGVLALDSGERTRVIGQADAPVKRGPGRPRKTPLAVVEASSMPLGGSLIGAGIGSAVAGLVGGPAPEQATRPVPEQVVGPVKRKPGRPRKHPLPEPGAPGLTPQLPVKAVPAPVAGPRVNGSGIVRESPRGVGPGNKEWTGTGLVDRFGIGPGNNDGIGFWPPKPDEMESVKIAAIDAGVVSGRKRGRKKKTEVSAENAPGMPGERASGPEIGGASAFCWKCGTYTRLVRLARGPARRACPRCHPERMADIDRPRINLDKTGMPCRDRGKCRPVRCFKAFDCEEMKRNR